MPRKAEVLEAQRRMRAGIDVDLVEMRFDAVICDCERCAPKLRKLRREPGQLLLSAGGLWNRRLQDWQDDVDACEGGVVFRAHPGQIAATEWWAKWLGAHAYRRENPPAFDLDDMPEDFDPDEIITDGVAVNPLTVYSALLSGGRRGGKTFWAFACAVVSYAVQFPDSIIWALSPARGADDTKPDEIRRYVAPNISPTWIRRQTIATGWELVNGANIMLKSGNANADPDAIKEGKANLVVMNEAQKMKARVYVVARGAISDQSGIVLMCANPPVEAKDQQWVADVAAETDSGKRDTVHLPFDPLENPHIDRRSLLAMQREVDERTFDIEVRGIFRAPADAVAYNWSRTDNEKPAPRPEVIAGGGQRPCPRTGLVDVTAEYLRSIDLFDGITNLFGLDFQVHPHMGGPCYRLYCYPGQVPNHENVILWGVDEVVLAGDELEWSAAAKGRGYDPLVTLLVGDGTGEYQHSRRRSTDSPPPDWKGRGSFSLLQGEGWHIVRPDPKIHKNNPHVVDRVRALTSLIQTADKRRRLYLDPDRCPKTCKAIREWPTVHGKPSRTHEAAHLGDGASYPIVRLFPRLMRSGNTDASGGRTNQHDDSRADAGDRFFGSGSTSGGGGRRRRNYGL
jgi:hypothetical protein